MSLRRDKAKIKNQKNQLPPDENPEGAVLMWQYYSARGLMRG